MLFDQRLSPAGTSRAALAGFSTERCVELPFVCCFFFFLIIIFANLFGFFFF